jgi:hypothetical protein
MPPAEVVYKALDEDCLLRGQLHPMVRDRLGRVRELAHVGVATLLGVERQEGRPVLVWEHVEGEALDEYLAAGRPDERRLRELARELLGHVETMHALGIVHGAIHERNVIVTPQGGLKLTHVSPLLYTDPQADVDAVESLLEEMGLLDAVEPPVSDLRQLRRRLADSAAPGEGASDDAAEKPLLTSRRMALAGAAAAAVAGALLAWAFWRVAADSQATPEAALPWPEVHRR